VGDEGSLDALGVSDIVEPLQLRRGGAELTLFSTVAVFGTALDITLAELSIEAFYPADAETARALRGHACR
jgi:MmyB-like transcription regulator ligand binding domain